jgi:nitrous oxidase accessory protein
MNKQHILMLLLSIFFGLECQGKTITVGKEENFSSIKQALQAAEAGDIIEIRPGIYHEHDLAVTKRITIRGINYPVIDGSNQYAMMTVKANGVRIEGLFFRNSGSANIQDISALKLDHVKDCEVLNNKLENNYFGIYLADCHRCTVEGNQIKGNYGKESESGNGIHNWKSDSITIRNNSVTGHRDGIYLEFTKHCNVADNESFGNVRYGLHFMFSDFNSYDHNEFRENGSGVAVMYTHDIVMKNNVFRHNWGAASYGLLLKNISKSVIDSNHFEDNTIGINLEESSDLQIRRNDFRRNGWAMKINASCIDDSIFSNNFIANTFDVSTNSFSNSNVFSRNYWDKYRGYDLDKDGYGDVAFRPVSFSSWVMEQVPYSVMLLRSMIMDVLDQVERVAPAVIPESLLDSEPVMNEISAPKIQSKKTRALSRKAGIRNC